MVCIRGGMGTFFIVRYEGGRMCRMRLTDPGEGYLGAFFGVCVGVCERDRTNGSAKKSHVRGQMRPFLVAQSFSANEGYHPNHQEKDKRRK